MSTITTSWSGRRVLVTGATGIIGSWLVRRLVDEGADVVALVIDHDPRSELVRSGTIADVTVVNGALESYSTVERAITTHGVETVLHLGAQTIVGTAQLAPRATFEANIRGTWNVLDACRAHPETVRGVVVASSDKAYGEQTDLPYREEMALLGRFPYEVSKSCADLVAQAYAHTYDLPVAIARTGNVYGGGDLNWSRIVPGTIRSLLEDEQPVLRSDGSHVRDYVFVDDAVDAYLTLAHALDDPDVRGRAFNFSDESPLSVTDLYDAICEAVGAGRVEPLVLNDTAGEIHDQYLDATRARTELGWKPRVSLSEGLARTVAWYRTFLGAPSQP